jgi:hypothetical protein
MFLFAVVLCGGFLMLGLHLFQSSWACTAGVDLARNNQEVVQALGEPIQRGSLVVGTFNDSGNSGNADLTIPLSGPKNDGVLRVVAHKSKGQWKFDDAIVTVAKSNKTIDLLKK